MACDKCGSHTPNRYLCKQCQLIERHSDGPVGGERPSSPPLQVVECTFDGCGQGEYLRAGSTKCPSCGVAHYRFVRDPDTDDYLELREPRITPSQRRRRARLPAMRGGAA